LPIYLQYRY